MITFTMKSGRLQMEESFLMVPEFVTIWKSDKTKDKKNAHKLLFYVYLMCDLTENCPTKDLGQETKDAQCRFMAFGTKDYIFNGREEVMVIDAIDSYVLLNEVPEERMLRTYDAKIDQIRILLDATKPAIQEGLNKDGNTIYSTNVDIINKALKEISSLVKAKHDLKQAVLAGLSAGHVRGQLKLSPRDKKKLRKVK